MARAGRAASLSRRAATERGCVPAPRYTHADSDRSRFQSSDGNSEEIAAVLSALGRRTFWPASILAPPRHPSLEARRGFGGEVLALDFDRIIVSHGNVLEGGGHEHFAEAFAFLGK